MRPPNPNAYPSHSRQERRQGAYWLAGICIIMFLFCVAYSAYLLHPRDSEWICTKSEMSAIIAPTIPPKIKGRPVCVRWENLRTGQVLEYTDKERQL